MPLRPGAGRASRFVLVEERWLGVTCRLSRSLFIRPWLIQQGVAMFSMLYPEWDLDASQLCHIRALHAMCPVAA